MRYGSVCSGVEAATVAWHGLGWKPQWFSEIEKFPSAVLQHHYPDVPNFGDMRKFKEWPDDGTNGVDLIVGGPPCQDFSVAGLRQGLDDPRGNLMLTYLSIAAKYRPRWVVWENVPGVLSSNKGRDFGTFLGALGKIGYGFAYRLCDAQYWGLAQRRKRVFVVGCLGDWRRAAAVLFERESLQGHPPPSRETGQEVAGATAPGAAVGGGGGRPEGAAVNHFVPEVSDALQTTCNDYSRADGFTMIAGPLTAGMHKGPRGTEAIESNHVVAFPAELSGTQSATTAELSPALSVSHKTAVANNMQVRRLTPRECERLQGFSDDYTQIPWRNKAPEKCPDGPRYKCMGNSMAVPVMRWIGERIQMVEDIT
jgi:DNA (cytosine-5)-methyltransferase 1